MSLPRGGWRCRGAGSRAGPRCRAGTGGEASRDASKSSWGPAAGRRCPAGVTAGLMRCGGLSKWGLGGWAISHARPQRRVPCARENKVFCLRAPHSETHLLDRHSQTRAGSVSLGGAAGGVSRGRDPVPQGPHERAFGPCQLSRVSPGFSFAATAPAAAPAPGSAPPAPSCPLLRPPSCVSLGLDTCRL